MNKEDQAKELITDEIDKALTLLVDNCVKVAGEFNSKSIPLDYLQGVKDSIMKGLRGE